jgi:hypothetical protein
LVLSFAAVVVVIVVAAAAAVAVVILAATAAVAVVVAVVPAAAIVVVVVVATAAAAVVTAAAGVVVVTAVAVAGWLPVPSSFDTLVLGIRLVSGMGCNKELAKTNHNLRCGSFSGRTSWASHSWVPPGVSPSPNPSSNDDKRPTSLWKGEGGCGASGCGVTSLLRGVEGV